MEQLLPEALFDERGNPNYGRPLLQGDVFRGVDVACLGGDTELIQVIAHPCVIRRGAELAARIAVVPVGRLPSRVVDATWQNSVRKVPLPDLLEDDEPYASDLVSIGSVAGTALELDKRVATLSNNGILMLQQRLIMHMTRLKVDMPALRKQSAPVLTEAELQETWVSAALRAGNVSISNALDESVKFQAWLSQGDPPLRRLLESESDHARLQGS